MNDNLVINFIFPLPGNKKKEIFIPLKTRNEFQKTINEQLIQKVNVLEEKLNKEIEENKIYRTIIIENKNVINELKEEIEILRKEIIDLQKSQKEREKKSEKEKEREREREKNSNIIKYRKDTKIDIKGKKKEEKKEKKKEEKKEKKKEEKKEKKKEEKKEERVEEKKQIILNPRYIYKVSDELKNNAGLFCLYLTLKGKYLDKKNILHIATNNPLLYKSMGSNMKYLLNDKKKAVQNKADEIEKFLNEYGELNFFLTKEFSLSRKGMLSIQFFKKKEEEEIQKMAEIPKEVEMIIKCIYYIIDEPFDERMNSKQLYENLISNVLSKTEDKTFKSLLEKYFEHNKYLNLTKEKCDKINNIINENNVILNMITMTKLCRPISLFCFFLKDVHDYINLRTLDGQYYYNLRLKFGELQKYKDILYLIENDGKKREPEEPS